MRIYDLKAFRLQMAQLQLIQESGMKAPYGLIKVEL